MDRVLDDSKVIYNTLLLNAVTYFYTFIPRVYHFPKSANQPCVKICTKENDHIFTKKRCPVNLTLHDPD